MLHCRNKLSGLVSPPVKLHLLVVGLSLSVSLSESVETSALKAGVFHTIDIAFQNAIAWEPEE